ncbi:hypothetical protein B0T25DRAFT_579334 [Lasiosphaeria hispida]|uniref:BRCT domain-containing protein n=1 Tax=Lasiosphaeria hispida TaxID=260671 RepID=A0AAJ0HMD0_9PEZI|nr:hypothetical protein B0T25DRAFT_579334 [Lasiosphaeria hispida]
MPPRKEKPIFQGITIALAGELAGQWNDTNITRWVSQREGVISYQMDSSVTHLICSEDEFKKKSPRIKAALKRGKKECQIVTVDWLEDSINKRRRLPEREYSLDKSLKGERAKQRQDSKVAKGLEQGEKAVNTYLYHPYSDRTFFRYEITMTRDDDDHDIHGERYKLSPPLGGARPQLYESNAKPRLYWFVAKFFKRKGDSQPKFHRPSDFPGLFAKEFGLFEAFFQVKTGIPWERRLVAQKPLDEKGKVFFRYTPPVGGKPVGFVKGDFMPRASPEVEGAPEGAGQASAVAEPVVQPENLLSKELPAAVVQTQPVDNPEELTEQVRTEPESVQEELAAAGKAPI